MTLLTRNSWLAIRRRISRSTSAWLVCFALSGLRGHAGSARFADHIRFVQSDGTVLELVGEGNEYQAVYETLDGYTVVFVPEGEAYHYATPSADGHELVSTGLAVGRDDPASLDLGQHVRLETQISREQARRARVEFEQQGSITERWAGLKAARTAAQGPQLSMLRYGPTLGTKCGLTLMIDFEDTPSTLTRAAVEAFINGDHYQDKGNKGSVKEY